MSDARIPIAQNPEEDERVFRAPWEARAFAIAVALVEAGFCSWEEFRQRLIMAINREGASEDYYRNWLRALQSLLHDKGTVTTEEIAQEIAILVANPPHPKPHSHAPDKPLVTFPPRSKAAK